MAALLRTRASRRPPRLRRWAAWPFRTLRRLTHDGLLLIALALPLSLAALRSEQIANVPLLAALILVSLLLTALALSGRGLDRLSLTRRHPARAFAGERVAVRLTVTNPTALPLTGITVRETLRAQLAGPVLTARTRGLPPAAGRPADGRLEGSAFLAAVPGRGRAQARYMMLARRRGIYSFEPPRLATSAPLGLWRTRAERPLPGCLVVYPRLGRVDPGFFKELDEALARIRRYRACREEQDFRGLREFRPGDSPKWIHWRSSARLGQPLVREFEEPQSRRVVIFVDTHLPRASGLGRAAFERAVSFAATAAWELVRRNCEVACGALAPPGRWEYQTVSRERRNLDALLTLLAGLQPDAQRDFSAAAPFVPRAALHHSFVLLLGLGSTRARPALGWLHAPGNQVKILEVQSEEFRRVFRRDLAGSPPAFGPARARYSAGARVADGA